MAKAVCCDRCGKFAKAVGEDVPAGWTPLLVDGSELVLCPSCKVRLEEFMKPPVVREG